jgi:DNA repair protein RecO (recombination protein O)
MRVSDKAIVLQAIRYGDQKFVLKLFTQSHGLVTCMATAGKSPGARIKSGYLLPLSLLHVNLSMRQNREMQMLTEASCYFVNTGFSGDLAKLGIAQFINEVLLKALREHPAPSNERDLEMFSFIESTVKFLIDAEKDFVNLHLYFLREFASYLGFEPQNNYSSEEKYFDCREGRFSPEPLAFPLGLKAEESAYFSRFLEQNVLQAEIRFEQRQHLLEILLAYFALHVPSFGEVQSLEVLRHVLH